MKRKSIEKSRDGKDKRKKKEEEERELMRENHFGKVQSTLIYLFLMRKGKITSNKALPRLPKPVIDIIAYYMFQPIFPVMSAIISNSFYDIEQFVKGKSIMSAQEIFDQSQLIDNGLLFMKYQAQHINRVKSIMIRYTEHIQTEQDIETQQQIQILHKQIDKEIY